jgi:hypothetical protein
LIERWQLGTCVAYENVDAPEVVFHLLKDAVDILRAGNVGLDHESIGLIRANACERVVSGVGVLIVVHGYLNALLSQPQGNASTNPARATSDQGTL